MLSFVIYWIYNLIYQILLIGFLFYANTYLNSFFIPDSFRWKDGKLRDDLTALASAQTIALVVEAGILLFLIYYFNRWFLTNVVKADNAYSIATWTSVFCGLITLAFIVFLIITAFK